MTGGSTVHNVAYADDVVRVSVKIFLMVMLKSHSRCQKLRLKFSREIVHRRITYIAIASNAV